MERLPALLNEWPTEPEGNGFLNLTTDGLIKLVIHPYRAESSTTLTDPQAMAAIIEAFHQSHFSKVQEEPNIDDGQTDLLTVSYGNPSSVDIFLTDGRYVRAFPRGTMKWMEIDREDGARLMALLRGYTVIEPDS